MAGYGGGGYGGGGYGGGYGGGGSTGAAGVAPNPAATAAASGAAAPAQTASTAQQMSQLMADITRIQASNPLPGSPTANYLSGLQQQYNTLVQQSRAPAAGPAGGGGFAQPGVQPAMQQDNNRSLNDLAQNGAARNIGTMSGLGAAKQQAANVAGGRTPTGQAIQAPTIEGPSQKSLYSFVPSAQNGQNPTGLDSNYLGFLQQVFNQNRQNPLMMGAGGGTNGNQTGASGIHV